MLRQKPCDAGGDSDDGGVGGRDVFAATAHTGHFYPVSPKGSAVLGRGGFLGFGGASAKTAALGRLSLPRPGAS